MIRSRGRLLIVALTQNISWKLPYQRAGAADCYHVPNVSGEGNQQIRFAGSGLVEATRVGHNAPTFSYMHGGRTRPGIGEGHAGIDRVGHRVRHVESGPCGPSNEPDYDSFSECGSQSHHWTYRLESPQRNRVALSGDEALGSLASGATFAFCPLMSTGITGVGDLGYLDHRQDADPLDRQPHPCGAPPVPDRPVERCSVEIRFPLIPFAMPQ
jgi:hypothetical protein